MRIYFELSNVLFSSSDRKPTVTVDALRGFTGMLDRSRMALCVFMFTVFIINPLNFFFAGQDSLNGADYSLAHGTGRALQSSTGN